ncbi:MAG: hypothetical protein FWH33_03980 [Oscillospiraceae bacterium]|nr:hypothetical protein [Oscillospiraceae bacterium]
MTNVEVLTGNYAKVPRIEETGPQHGYNGKRMARLGRRTRLIHAILCVIGLLPMVLKLSGIDVPPMLVAFGLGFLVPGGGFVACAGPATVLIGLFVCFYLWRKRGMMIQEIYGSFLGIAGFWLLGALGGLLAGITWFDRIRLPAWCGYIFAIVLAFALFLPYEIRVRKMYKLMKDARTERTAAFDESISELDALTSTPYEEGTQELDEEQMKAARFLLNAAVNREEGDLSGFEWMRGLAEYRYQLSAFGYGLMLLHAKYLPNFTGYLKKAHRFLIEGYSDPRSCAYWAREALTGYFSKNPDPVVKANVMLSGWMMPVVAGYHDQYHDDEYDKDASIRFRPIKDNPEQTYDYSSKGIVEVLHRQFNNQEYPYMLIPCEPHLAFPTCNSFGLLGMLMYDRDHGTHYCEDFWDRLYDNINREFIEIDGSMALRRQYQYGLRHLPASQIGYDPLADVQNYLHYLPIFPGLSRRCYAQIRKHEVEFRDGVAYLKRKPWDKIINMFTRKPDASLQIALLEMTAAEYGDTELVAGLRKAEEMNLARSKEPGSFKYKDVNSLTMAYYAFSRLCKKGYWSDVILRGMPETAFTGPLLSDCAYPDVIPAKAASNGADLDLVLYNGAEPGEKPITVERLKPSTVYTINNGKAEFTSDADGRAELLVNVDGRTEVMIAEKI